MRSLRRGFGRMQQVVAQGVEFAVGRPKLRGCDVVGRWSRVRSGRAVIDNRGRIEIGSRTRLTGDYGPVELRTAPTGLLTIGSRTAINFATLVDASERVTIGDHVSVGPYCIIADTELGADGSADVSPPAPITISDRVWLASRVTVLPGTEIGAGSVITAGSIVEGRIPSGVVAGGIPARVLRRLDGHDDVPEVGTAEDAPVRSAAPRPEPIASGLLISDFTIDPLVPALEAVTPALTAEIAPFGAVVATLMQPPPSGRDLAVVWTKPEQALPSFRAVLEYAPADADTLVAEVDRFAAQIRDGLGAFRCVVVPTWTVPPWLHGRGLTDHRPGGIGWALALVNQRLMGALADAANVFVLDAQRWLTLVGEGAYNDRLYFLGKIPFDERVFRLAADDIAAAYAALQGGARKLVVLDLDNTLWGGVVGDIGWEELRLGGHDAAGEAFVAFQQALKALQRRGILLAIVSKNEEAVALDAIDRHGSMALRRDDFVGWRINWSDKAANVAELAAELNLGLQSIVFIDDNPHERARVAAALPEVLVPDWPDDPTQFVRALASLRCFDTVALTAEDLDRTAMYAAEQRRAALRTDVGSLDDWLRDLQMVVRVEPLDAGNLARATQLLNKTNQMNLRTRRLTAAELAAWPARGRRTTWCVTVADRLGDAGLTGLVSVEVDGGTARLVDFVLSCRVMGRRVEETMVHLACLMAIDLSASKLEAQYVPTAKNAPCSRFFESGPLPPTGDGTYALELGEPTPAPDSVKIELMTGSAQR